MWNSSAANSARNALLERGIQTEEPNLIGHCSVDDEPSRSSIVVLGYALETVAFTRNRVPSKSVEKTPYEIWTGKRPELSFLKVWGCEAYVKRLMSDKLTPKSDKCFFCGVS
jgi:hypothetical protein